jgi:hypothetical protein
MLGEWPSGNVVILSGPPGGGKSSIAAALQPTAWFTNEQKAKGAAATHRRCGRGHMPKIHAFTGYVDEEIEWAISDVPDGLLVLDSLTNCGPLSEQLEVLKLLREWADGGGDAHRWCLVIQGVDKNDKPAGLRQLEHQVDAAAHLRMREDGTIVFHVRKNRSGPTGSVYFTNDENGVGRPELPYSYSVEGPKGGYVLTPYPSKGARWDGYLRKHFNDGPVTPGLASAAKPVAGYPRGVMEPRDLADRRRFAELHGLRWLEPA